MKEIELFSGEKIIIRKLENNDGWKLSEYYANLTEDSRKRYAPHSFDLETTTQICNENNSSYFRLIAENEERTKIIAYTVVKQGFVEYDVPRYQKYNWNFESHHNFTYAPSVADEYHSKGLGSKMLQEVFSFIEKYEKSCLILWGGVQSTNIKAVNFYLKHGFQKIGEFEHNGNNFDMFRLHSK